MHKGQWLYKAIADAGRDYYGAIRWERNDLSALDETTGKIIGAKVFLSKHLECETPTSCVRPGAKRLIRRKGAKRLLGRNF